MHNVQIEFRDLLLENIDLQALVEGRIYRNLSPKDAQYPLLILTQVGEHRREHLRGLVGLNEYRTQLDVIALEYFDGLSVYEVLKNFDAYRGGRFQKISTNSVREFAGKLDDGRIAHRFILDLTINYEDS